LRKSVGFVSAVFSGRSVISVADRSELSGSLAVFAHLAVGSVADGKFLGKTSFSVFSAVGAVLSIANRLDGAVNSACFASFTVGSVTNRHLLGKGSIGSGRCGSVLCSVRGSGSGDSGSGDSSDRSVEAVALLNFSFLS